jgi:hypothetical protein
MRSVRSERMARKPRSTATFWKPPPPEMRNPRLIMDVHTIVKSNMFQ